MSHERSTLNMRHYFPAIWEGSVEKCHYAPSLTSRKEAFTELIKAIPGLLKR